VKATVQFVGLVSNGLYQINAVIPGLPNGDQQVIATSNGVSSPAGSFITVHN